ncbi:hypothetical protein ACFQUU_23250 [Herbaspirillum sp. GCM10030257]
MAEFDLTIDVVNCEESGAYSSLFAFEPHLGTTQLVVPRLKRFT